MCGRFASTQTDADLVRAFRVEEVVGEQLAPSYNVAPTQPVRAVLERTPREEPEAPFMRQIRTVRWGLIPSWAKDRWLLGTHQGSVEPAHLQSYLDEFVFRFNRRRSRSRGMLFFRVLELAVAHAPVRYRDLVANSQPKKVTPKPTGSGGHPPSLDRPRADRPWRAT